VRQEERIAYRQTARQTKNKTGTSAKKRQKSTGEEPKQNTGAIED
jgi:hypothetical protein